MEGTQKFVVWNGQFGFHGGTYTDISKWLDLHPEYKKVFNWKLNDFTEFMRKYPVYDGTTHVLKSKPIQVDTYKKLSKGERNYDCRMDIDLKWLDEIKSNHKIIYKLQRISLEKVGVKTFERKVEKLEKFGSKNELLLKYPEIQITPSFNIPKWKQRLAQIFGNIVYPNNSPYTILWFSKI